MHGKLNEKCSTNLGIYKRKREAAIAAAVDKRIEEKLKETEKDSQDEQGLKNYIMSVIHQMKPNGAAPPSAIASSTITKNVTLQSILKKAKN